MLYQGFALLQCNLQASLVQKKLRAFLRWGNVRSFSDGLWVKKDLLLDHRSHPLPSRNFRQAKLPRAKPAPVRSAEPELRPRTQAGQEFAPGRPKGVPPDF